MHTEESVTVAVAHHSGYGHTERYAQGVVAGARQASEIGAVMYNMADFNDELWEGLAASDAIIFGTPTYTGSQTPVFQAFAEASGGVWAVQGWKDRAAADLTNSAGVNGYNLNTLTSLSVLAAQHGMQRVSLGLPPAWLYSSAGSVKDLNWLGGFLGAMAQFPSDAGADMAPSDADLQTAEHVVRRVAEVAVQLRHGAAELVQQ